MLVPLTLSVLAMILVEVKGHLRSVGSKSENFEIFKPSKLTLGESGT